MLGALFGTSIIMALISLALGLAMLYGYVMNIIRITKTKPFVVEGLMIVRLIGLVIAPVGAVMGFVKG
jgi:hypothetical protein